MVKIMEKTVGGAFKARQKASRPAAQTEMTSRDQQSFEWPAEGPHARADLINEAATPGSGLFSNAVSRGLHKVDPGAG